MPPSWHQYVEKTKNNPPRPLLIKAVGFVHAKDHALDLGSGALNDSVYLLSQGFRHVTAVDKELVAADIARTLPPEHFTYTISGFEDFVFPEQAYDLVNAQFSLPFISPANFSAVFEKIVRSLKPDGIFTGQFFGPRDSWSGNEDMIFLPRATAEKYLTGFDVIEFTEEEKDRPTALGDMKHWHIFHWIARKNHSNIA